MAKAYEVSGYLGLAHHDAWTGDAHINPFPASLTLFLTSQKPSSFFPEIQAGMDMCAPPLFQRSRLGWTCALLLFSKIYREPSDVRSSRTFPKCNQDVHMCSSPAFPRKRKQYHVFALFASSSPDMQDDNGMCASFPLFPKNIYHRFYMCGLLGAKKNQPLISLDTCLKTTLGKCHGVLLLLYQKTCMLSL